MRRETLYQTGSGHGECLSYFSIAVKKHHEQENL